MTNLQRALAYLAKLPPAISGAGGHDATFRAACECVRFGLAGAELAEAMAWFNANRCKPAWSERELAHKLADAERHARRGERVAEAQRRGRGPRVNFAAATLADGKRRGILPPPAAEASAEAVAEAQPVPVYLRSEEEEEAWWARVFAERGMVDPASKPGEDEPF